MRIYELFLFFLFNICTYRCLQVHFDSKHENHQYKSIKEISYCSTCPSPEKQGSLFSGLVAKYGPSPFFLTGEVAYAIPNLANSKKIVNKFDLKNRIALIERGNTTFIEKITNIQNTGAIAVIIIDDGQCNTDFSNCGYRIGSSHEGGFSCNDEKYMWDKITLPAILVSVDTGNKLRKLMSIQKMKLPKLGFQNVSHFTDENNLPFANDEF